MALVIILLAIALLAVAAGAIVTLGTRSLALSRAGADREQALMAAESGLAMTSQQLLGNPNFGGFTSWQRLRVTGAEYRTSLTHGPGTAPNGVSVPEGMHYILAEGRSRRQTRRVGMMVTLSQTNFKLAAFAAESVVMRHGSTVLSYNSDRGEYPAERGGGADVATNSTANDSVILRDEAQIFGDVLTGPGSRPRAVVVGPSATVHGRVREMNRVRQFEPITLPVDPTSLVDVAHSGGHVLLPPGNYGDLHLSGGTHLKLEAGQPYVFNSVTMLDDSAFVLDEDVSAPIQMFVKGTFDMSGGSVVNKTAKPSMLRFMAQADAITVNGRGTKAYFVVYAPQANIKVTSRGKIFGALVGRNIDLLDDALLAYDKALRNDPGPATDVEVISRQEF